jgi:hypothetical protein
MPIDINGKTSVLVLVEDTKLTSPMMMDIVKTLVARQKMCYITIAKTYDFVDKVLAEKEIDTSKVFYIDCISHTFKHTNNDPRAEFVKSPDDLSEISTAIRKAMSKGYSSFVFDSISSLSHILAAGNDSVNRFYQTFSNDLKRQKGVMVFLCAIEDEEKLLIQEAMPIFEKIMHLDSK